jgi:hypothetical protein
VHFTSGARTVSQASVHRLGHGIRVLWFEMRLGMIKVDPPLKQPESSTYVPQKA